MAWTLTDDVSEFLLHVRGLLEADPILNNVALTVADEILRGRRFGAEPMTFGWYGTEVVTGAVLMTPPHDLLLVAVPDGSVPELVVTLRERGTHVPGVNGVADDVDRFVAEWRGVSVVRQRQRVYRLARLQPPDPSPAGSPRLATAADEDLVLSWWEAFHAEAGSPVADQRSTVRTRILDQRIWLWCDPTGAPVSLAGRQLPAAGVVRVGPVYTPPSQRRRGYGAAVTAACSADALRCGEHVILFTDLANPTSNAIYQAIGYRPLRDSKIVQFSSR